MKVLRPFSYRRFLEGLSAQRIGFFSFTLNALFVGLCYLFLPLERPNYTEIRRRFTHYFPQVNPRRMRPLDGLRMTVQTFFLLFVKAFYFRHENFLQREPKKSLFGRIWHELTHWLSAPLRLGVRYYTDRFLNPQAEPRIFLRSVLGRIAFFLFLAVAVFVGLFCITKPFDLQGQVLFVIILGVFWMIFARMPTRFGLFMLMAISTVISARYMWWRTTETLNWDSNWGFFLSLILLLAEGYYFVVMVLSYFQLSWTLDRKPAPLPEDTSLWPTVDVYIPTYNEPLDVIKPTVYSSLKLDWPQDKLRVYILDDGSRSFIRDFAAECGCGYIIRKEHKHAKAGNINHAMTLTDGELIAIFDCDHVPVRSFLQLTVGQFLRDEKLALVQTPHYFYSPDPFERNLKLDEHAPPESSLFHDFIQKGNDTWNAAFFCGSCAVIRRKALEEVGGIAVETVTEDAHTSLRMNRRGWGSAFISMRLAAGLSTETLSAHVGQRIRWARGMVQIFRVDCPLFGRGLTFAQRICFITAMVHFFHGAPRLVFLVAPLPFLFFNTFVIDSTGVAILIYALPHLLFSALTSALTQEGHRQPLLGAIYETVLSWYIFIPTTIALFFPKLGKFNVTAKGGTVDSEYLDWSIARPYCVLIILNLLGLAFGIYRVLFWGGYELSANLVNIGWVLFNLIVLGASVAVAVETVQQRKFPRVKLNVPVAVRTRDGFLLDAKLLNFSQGGVFLSLDPKVPVMPFSRGDSLDIVFTHNGQNYEFPATVQFADSRRLLGLQMHFASWQKEQEFVSCTFARADMWFTHRKLEKGVGVDVYTSAVRLGEVSMQGYRAMAAHAPKILRFFISSIVRMFTWISSFIPRPAVFRKRWFFELAAVFTLCGLSLITLNAAEAAAEKAPQTAAGAAADPDRALIERVLKDSKELEGAAAPVQGEAAGLHRFTLNDITPGGTHEGSFRFDGVLTERGFRFGVRIDELVNRAELDLKFITSPSLIPSKTQINVFLNDALQQTVPLPAGENGKTTRAKVTLDPKNFKNLNTLRIEFISQAKSNCMSTGDPHLWAEVLGDSALTVKTQKVRIENDTAVLPEPFADRNIFGKSRIPFVFASVPDNAELKAASILASWFGTYLDWRGGEFPVYYGQDPADEHNVVFVTDAP
jgi:cellulose synthase (UDP-forming)